MNTSVQTSRIVVGIDASPNSIVALRRAVAEARIREAILEIVHVIPECSDAQAAATASRMISALTRQVFPGGLGVPARLRIERGSPAETLVRLCTRSDLLVIGACANSDRRGIYTSHVMRVCDRNAPCPVYVCADHGATSRNDSEGNAPAGVGKLPDSETILRPGFRVAREKPSDPLADEASLIDARMRPSQ